jgi:RNA polymerase sigma-70 factor (ECF subfamily)
VPEIPQNVSNSPPNFDAVVKDFYSDIFRFAYSLVRNEHDAVDLTQQTFLKFARKGHQIRDPSKVKSWLATTMKREFYNSLRREKAHPSVEIEEADRTGYVVDAKAVQSLDAHLAMDALAGIEEKYRLPLSLFYIQGLSYKEIAETLEIPMGTVMSRLSRGKETLRAALHV